MSYEQKLFEATVNLIEQRFGKNSDEGAAAVYTKSGKIITSTSPDTLNDSVTLCHETGAYCEAYKLDDPIIASICVHQGEDGKNLVFTPCGVCQERLFLYGDDVMVGVGMGVQPSAGEPLVWGGTGACPAVYSRLGEVQQGQEQWQRVEELQEELARSARKPHKLPNYCTGR